MAVNLWNGAAFVPPSSLNLWDGSAFAPPSGAYVWTGSAFEKVWPPAPTVAFDAVAPGFFGSSSPRNGHLASFSHPLDPAATAILAGVVSAGTVTTGMSCTISVGGVPMTQLYFDLVGQQGTSGVYTWIGVFGLLNPPTGSQAVSVATTGTGAASPLGVNTASYKGVSSIGTPILASGAGSSVAHTVSGAPTGVVFETICNTTPTAGVGFSSYNQNSRWAHASGSTSGSGINDAILIGDAPGAASVGFSAVNGDTSGWASVAVPLS